MNPAGYAAGFMPMGDYCRILTQAMKPPLPPFLPDLRQARGWQGIQCAGAIKIKSSWIPAFAGMTCTKRLRRNALPATSLSMAFPAIYEVHGGRVRMGEGRGCRGARPPGWRPPQGSKRKPCFSRSEPLTRAGRAGERYPNNAGGLWPFRPTDPLPPPDRKNV